MRFGNFISEDKSEFYNTVSRLSGYDDTRLKNVLLASWLKLRESLTHKDQETLIHVINETLGTDYENVYFVPTQIGSIPSNWKDKVKVVGNTWIQLHESLDNNVELSCGLMWVRLVSEV